jgi:hypothetical protein
MKPTMETAELRQLLKEAFEAGRDYQYAINPYSGKPSIFSDVLSFTKWVNAKFKLLGLHNVSKCYTEKDMDNAYDKGIKDGGKNDLTGSLIEVL